MAKFVCLCLQFLRIALSIGNSLQFGNFLRLLITISDRIACSCWLSPMQFLILFNHSAFLSCSLSTLQMSLQNFLLSSASGIVSTPSRISFDLVGTFYVVVHISAALASILCFNSSITIVIPFSLILYFFSSCSIFPLFLNSSRFILPNMLISFLQFAVLFLSE